MDEKGGFSVRWKMRNETNYRTLNLQRATLVMDIRSTLKQLLHIESVSGLDLLVYNENALDSCLSDYYPVKSGMTLLAARMPVSDANVLLSEANSAASVDKDRTSVTVHDGSRNGETQILEPEISPTSLDLRSIETHEDARIKAMMAQHAKHRGPQTNSESLAQRYSRNKNLTLTKDMMILSDISNESSTNKKVSLPPTTFPTKKVKLPNSNLSQIPNIPVSKDYICHMCGMTGHHIRNCFKAHDSRNQKRVKPATGIPINFLAKISKDEIANHPDVYVLKDGSFAIMRNIEAVSGSAYFSKSIEQKVNSRFGGSQGAITEHLTCKICKTLLNEPAIVPCCGETFCSRCVGSSCFSCRESVTQADLVINRVIQDTIDAVLRRKIG